MLKKINNCKNLNQITVKNEDDIYALFCVFDVVVEGKVFEIHLLIK